MTNAPQNPTPWWHPERHADRRPLLLGRNKIQAAFRTYFAAADFTEVDPLGMQVSPGNETHLHAFSTRLIGNDGEASTMYLHTSPEFAMKRLLAAGETRIHAFSHVWRNRERGQKHSPEFTMLEWYRAGEDYTVLMEDTVALLRAACTAAGAEVLRYRGETCDPFLEPERLSVAEGFLRYANIDLLATMDASGTPDAALLAAQLTREGIGFDAQNDTWSDMLSRVLVECVEPHLGHGRITILDRYPSHEAALARRTPDDARVAERFEVYACGVELANGFGELTDPAEQRLRFQKEMDEKERLYGERYPIDEDFLAALALMPAASGIALGFERAVMLATGAPSIDHVIWTPFAR